MADIASDFDIAFVGAKEGSRQRVAGMLSFASGSAFRAYSGSRSLLPLPSGRYLCSNLRRRDKREMARDVEWAEAGMCFPAWSVDLEPLFTTNRTLLRIHPDGNLPGTEGCIGVLDRVDQCYDELEALLGTGGVKILLVNHNNV
jgi:hypothetical protein